MARQANGKIVVTTHICRQKERKQAAELAKRDENGGRARWFSVIIARQRRSRTCRTSPADEGS
jgi:hypothetical protein